MKIWTDENPKAAMMLQKRNAIIEAAGKVFLDSGYLGSSMQRIADLAGVSIKTVYRHFENKDDLFVAVIKFACITFSDDNLDINNEPSWYKLAPAQALKVAADSYFRHVIDKDHLALFRIINRDSDKFPELGKKYYQEVTMHRNLRLINYLEKFNQKYQWEISNFESASDTFAAIVRGQLFENLLLGFQSPTEEEIEKHIDFNVELMLYLLEKNKF